VLTIAQNASIRLYFALGAAQCSSNASIPFPLSIKNNGLLKINHLTEYENFLMCFGILTLDQRRKFGTESRIMAGNPNIAEIGKPYRFQPGNPGSPGRPRKTPLTDELRGLVEELDPRTRRKIARRMAEEITKKALKGSVQHFSEIADRVEGKPLQRQAILTINLGSEDIEAARELAASLVTPPQIEQTTEVISIPEELP
jgi:hypothetical protein